MKAARRSLALHPPPKCQKRALSETSSCRAKGLVVSRVGSGPALTTYVIHRLDETRLPRDETPTSDETLDSRSATGCRLVTKWLLSLRAQHIFVYLASCSLGSTYLATHRPPLAGRGRTGAL